MYVCTYNFTDDWTWCRWRRSWRAIDDTNGWMADVHVVATASLRGDDRSRWSPSSGSSRPELRSWRSRRDSYGVHSRSLGRLSWPAIKKVFPIKSVIICILRFLLIKHYRKISCVFITTWFCKNSRFALNPPTREKTKEGENKVWFC